MQNKKLITFTVILLLLVTFLLTKKEKPSAILNSNKNTKANTISLQISENNSLKNPVKNIQKVPETHVAVEPEVSVTIHQSTTQQSSDELSYLDVYRMSRKFEPCQNVLYRLVEDDAIDAVTEFENRIKHLKDLHPEWPTPAQISAVMEHANQCQQLLNKVKSIDLPEAVVKEGVKLANLYEIKQQLEQYLLTLKPKTIKEQAIADVLNLIVIWREHYQHVLDASKGDETLNQTQIENIQQQINALNQERQELSTEYQNNQDAEVREHMVEIWLAVENLKEQIVALKVVDPEIRKQVIFDFEVATEMLFASLRSSDPDVFYEAQRALELNRHNVRNFGYLPYKNHSNKDLKEPFVEYVSPGEVVKNLIGIQDDEMFGLVINYATQLYHCELGADCGPGGEWIPYFCHLGYDQLSADACNLDLPTFLRDHYLNSNQWQDVQFVLDLLRSLYAN
ncbi:MAG: hypothetical protein R3E90_13370 [Marinicella sp.]